MGPTSVFSGSVSLSLSLSLSNPANGFVAMGGAVGLNVVFLVKWLGR